MINFFFCSFFFSVPDALSALSCASDAACLALLAESCAESLELLADLLFEPDELSLLLLLSSLLLGVFLLSSVSEVLISDKYEIEKIIYGFPSQEIFDEMMKTNKYSIDEQLKAIDNSPITEDYEYTHLSDIEKADMVLDVFYGEVSDGYNNFSVYAMDILRKYTNLVHDAIKSNRHYSRYTRDDLQDIYDMGIQYLTLCSELKLYKC